MVFSRLDWDGRIALGLDGSLVSGTLTNFPLMVNLTSDAGKTSFDATTVFSGLDPSGYDSYTKAVFRADTITTFSGVSSITPIGNIVTYSGTGDMFGYSYYCDGSGDGLEIPANTDWSFGTDDFTIDAWVNKDSSTGSHRIVSCGSVVHTNGTWCLGVGSNGAWGSGFRINFATRVGGTIYDYNSDDITGYLTQTHWHHVAITMVSGVLYFYFNGKQFGSAACTDDLTNSNKLVLGARYNDGTDTTITESMLGYISECRVSKGVARWTEEFYPPTGPYGTSYDNRKQIAFTTTVSGVETESSVEIEYWDSSINEARLWANIPTLTSGTQATYYLYYSITQPNNSNIGDIGDTIATTVWSGSGESAVYHLSQNIPGASADSVKDSSNNTYHLTGTADMSIDDVIVSGTAGKITDFNSANGYLNDSGDNYTDDMGLLVRAKFDSITGGSFNGLAIASHTGLDSGLGLTLSYDYESVHPTQANSAGNFDVYSYTDDNYGADVAVDIWYTFLLQKNGSNIELYLDGVLVRTLAYNTDLVGAGTKIAAGLTIGQGHNAASGELDGQIAEVRTFKSNPQTLNYAKISHESLSDSLITYSTSQIIDFIFSSPFPEDLSTAYGLSKNLQITVDVVPSGTYPTYDAIFYDGSASQIVVISGTTIGLPVTASGYSTASGTDYSYYVTASMSGVASTSSTYTFTNKFLYSGTVTEQGVEASGIPIRLHLRSTGAVVNNTVCTSSGTFSVVADDNAEHYAIALHTSSDYNARIYDRIVPTV